MPPSTQPRRNQNLRRSDIRCYKNYIPKNFNEDLEQALKDPQLTELIQMEKVDEATERWVKIFSDTAERHAPMKEGTKNKKRNYIPWFTPELGALIAEKSRRLKTILDRWLSY